MEMTHAYLPLLVPLVWPTVQVRLAPCHVLLQKKV